MNGIQKIEYKNRKYIWEDTADDFSMFRIKEENPTDIPVKLTKYYKLTDYSTDSFLNNYIYAAHPKKLNDPFNCYSRLIDTSEITEKNIDFIEKRIRVKIDRDFLFNKNHQKDLIEMFYDLIFGGCGIISITDAKNENPSLWANYADNHKEFSVTYRTEAFKNVALGPFKVDYIDKLEKQIYSSDIFNALILWLTCIKSKYWANEEEWRLIGIGKDKMYIPYKYLNNKIELTKNNRKLFLPYNSISEVKLGFYFFEYENIWENNSNELVVNLKNESNKELKIKLLSNIQKNQIPLSLVHLNDNDFKILSFGLNYDFNKDTEIFKWKIPRNLNK